MDETTPTDKPGELKGWDAYVAEAQRPPVLLRLSDTDVLTATMPTRRQLRRINEALRRGDDDEVVTVLFGPEDAARLIELAEDAPGVALNTVAWDTLGRFGLAAVVRTTGPRSDATPGNSSTSST